MIESNGRKACFRYDQDMRVSNVYADVCDPEQPLVGALPAPLNTPQREYLQYTPLGQLDTLTANKDATRAVDATVSFAYDSLGRTTDQIVTSGDTTVPSYTVHHEFVDQIQAVTTNIAVNGVAAPLPVWFQQQYDSLGRLGNVTLNGSTTPIAKYDYGSSGVGGPLSVSYSNGAKASFTYDDKLRQTGIDINITPAAGGPNRLIASLHEAFGADSVPRMRQRQIGTGRVVTDVFQVDGDSRVTGESLLLPGLIVPQQEIDNTYSAVNSNIKSGPAWRSYGLDNIGNWKTVTTASGPVTYPTDDLSRLTGVGSQPTSIDPVDNIQGLTNDRIQFSFDSFTGSMLKAVNAGTTASYTYDALGRRAVESIAGGSRTAFLWDGETLIAHGDPSNLTIDIPSDDIDGHVASVEQNGTGAIRFYHQGSDQSVLAVSDTNGVVEGYSYSAFGEPSIWSPQGAALTNSMIGNRFLFQGHIYDPLTGTYSMRARQYQPKWGRFLSPDPLSVSASPSLYAFTGGRPLSRRDPLGLCDVADGYSNCIDPLPIPPPISTGPRPTGGNAGSGSGLGPPPATCFGTDPCAHPVRTPPPQNGVKVGVPSDHRGLGVDITRPLTREQQVAVSNWIWTNSAFSVFSNLPNGYRRLTLFRELQARANWEAGNYYSWAWNRVSANVYSQLFGIDDSRGAAAGVVERVNGRLPINSQYAGSQHPSGVYFTENGFPDFSPYAIKTVEVNGLNGDYTHDAKLANEVADLPSTPEGTAWHHVNTTTMQLMEQDIHSAVRHTGGSAMIRDLNTVPRMRINLLPEPVIP